MSEASDAVDQAILNTLVAGEENIIDGDKNKTATLGDQIKAAEYIRKLDADAAARTNRTAGIWQANFNN